MKKYKNYQIYKTHSKEKDGGSQLLEITGGMLAPFKDSLFNAKIIMNIQKSNKENVKITNAEFFFGIEKWLHLAEGFKSGDYLTKSLVIKLDALAGLLLKHAKYSNTDAQEELMAEYDIARNNIISAKPITAKMLYEEFEGKYNHSKPGDKMSLVNLPFFDSIITLEGGTTAAASKRADKKPLARIFEIAPGSRSDWILVIKTGPGKENSLSNGGFRIEKVENTLRFPMKTEEITELFMISSKAIEAYLNGNKELFSEVAVEE